MRPIFEEYTENYSHTCLMLRGDSGYAAPELYELCEQYGVGYIIRLKANACLYALAAELDERLTEQTRENMIEYSEIYGDFMYQADSWSKARRVVCKIEKPKTAWNIALRSLSQIQHHRQIRGLAYALFIVNDKNNLSFTINPLISTM